MDSLRSTATAPRARGPALADDAIFELLPMAAYVCDRDGLILRHNRKAAEYWGRSPCRRDGERFCGSHRLFRPDGRLLPRHRTPMADVLCSGNPARNIELLIEQPNGARVSVLVDVDPIKNEAGEVRGAISCFREMTEPCKAEEQAHETSDVLPAPVGVARQSIDPVAGESTPEEAWRERDRHLAQMLEALPAAVYTTDTAGRITSYNQAAVDLWGCRPDLDKDRWCGSWRLYRPDGTPLPHDQCPMAVALKENRPVRSAEAILERPDGCLLYTSPSPRDS